MAVAAASLKNFAQGVNRRYKISEPDSFWSCEGDFRVLLQSKFVAASINVQLEKLSKSPHFFGDWPQNEVILHRDSTWALSIVRANEQLRYIHVFPFLGLLSIAGHGDLSYDVYPLPAGYRNDVFEPTLRLGMPEPATIRSNEIVRIDHRFAYDFRITKPTLLIKFSTAALKPLEWLFSRETLHPWQANDADLTFTQLRIAAHLLGRFAHQSSLPSLKRLSNHPHHAVRWAAIQSLGRISRSEALARLESALNDSHPHIQRAATKTLAQLRPPR